MADYYSLLSRAVANLPKPSPPAARKAVYDRARRALNNQLRALKPPMLESEIAREEAALEAAVSRLEAEVEGSGEAAAAAPTAAADAAAAGAPKPATTSLRPPSRPAAPSPRSASPPAQPAAGATRPSAPSAHQPAPPRPAPTVRPPAPRPPTPRPATPRPSAPPSAGPPSAAATSVTPEAAPTAPRPAIHAHAPAPRPSMAPRLGAANEPIGGVVASAPAVYAPLGEEEAHGATPPTPPLPTPRGGDASRPSAPRAEEARAGRAWLWISLAAIVAIVGAVAVAAFLLRSQRPQDLAIKEPLTETTQPQVVDNGPKIDARASGETSSTPEATPSPAPSPSPSPSASPTPSPSPSPASAPASTPTPAPAPAPTPAAAPTSAPSPAASASPTPPPPILGQTTVARAAMLVAQPQDAQKPAISIGSAVWSTVPPNPGQNSGPGVKADVQIPELKMHATMILRRNADSSLPASHTIDLRVTFEDGSAIKGVKDIAVPQMRREDPPQSTPLSGVKVMINETYFLVGLNSAAADIQRNLDAIASGTWFDFPMLLNDGRIAKLTFEKATEGDKIVSAALAAWK